MIGFLVTFAVLAVIIFASEPDAFRINRREVTKRGPVYRRRF